MKRYVEHFKSIQSQLPECILAFMKQFCLHDEGVERIHAPAREQVFVELEMHRIEFTGVTRSVFPAPEELHERTIWLYQEIDLVAPGVFAVRVLFDAYGFEVEATEVKVFDKRLGRYALPAEPPPPPPTLFADRAKGTRRTRP